MTSLLTVLQKQLGSARFHKLALAHDIDKRMSYVWEIQAKFRR